MERQSRRHYTAEYKSQAVSLVDSLGLAGAARKLGISAKTLANWVRLPRDVKSAGAGTRRSVSELEAEVSRLRAESATLRMERDFLKKRRRSSPRSPGEIRLHRCPRERLSDRADVSCVAGVALGVFRLESASRAASARCGCSGSRGYAASAPKESPAVRPPTSDARVARARSLHQSQACTSADA